MAQILVNSTNTIYTTTFTVATKTITLSGENNFPLDIDSLDSVYNVTHPGIFPLAALQFYWYRANDLPIYTWIFSALPANSAGSDTLNMLLNVSEYNAGLSLAQKQASASAGSPGTFVASETPSGTINGTNKVFTLANTPNGGVLVLLTPSGGSATVQQQLVPTTSYEQCQYTLNGSTITFFTAPPTGATLSAQYYHN